MKGWKVGIAAAVCACSPDVGVPSTGGAQMDGIAAEAGSIPVEVDSPEEIATETDVADGGTDDSEDSAAAATDAVFADDGETGSTDAVGDAEIATLTTCSAGKAVVQCPASDGCHKGVLVPLGCTQVELADGTSCGPSAIGCGLSMRCFSGECVAISSCDDDIGCTLDSCSAAGLCEHVPIDLICEDSIACTSDACDPTAGCKHVADDKFCDDGEPCTIDHCVSTFAGKNCSHQAEPNGKSCGPKLDSCGSFVSCQSGVCTPYFNCSDGSDCTVDSCGSAGCTHVPTDCDDGNPCTIDACAGKKCAHTAAKGTPCDGGSCWDSKCLPLPSPDTCTTAKPCDDQIACTIDTCVNGVCAHSPSDSVCNFNNYFCGWGVCLPSHPKASKTSGCYFADNGAECQHGCCKSECLQGACVDLDCGPFPVPGDQCTVNWCDQGIDLDPDSSFGPCDDGDPMTVNDTCISKPANDGAVGVCIGQPVYCDDGNPCTQDSVYNKCLHIPLSCSSCPGGSCVAGKCCPDSCVDAPCSPACVGSCGTCAARETCSDSGACVPDGMILIPAATFVQGCDLATDSSCAVDELPAHEVQLAAYWIARTELRAAEYAACVVAGACTLPKIQPLELCTVFFFVNALRPATCLTAAQAAAACAWLVPGGRLPTEAEWEYAARKDDRRFPWGNASPTSAVGNFADAFGSSLGYPTITGYSDGFALAAPVGSFAAGASPFGLADVAGNVWEWVADAYDAGFYFKAPKFNPFNAVGTLQIIRGGSFENGLADVRTTRRVGISPTTSAMNVGVRCARDGN